MAWDKTKPAGADKIKDSDDALRANFSVLEDVLGCLAGGTPTDFLTVPTSGVTIFNDGEADIDFRVAATGATNAFFIQGSNGKIGIGTAVIPHGGIGTAMLAIEGAATDFANLPTIQFTTATDDYPILSISPYTHDSMGIKFDAYHSTAGQDRSSDAGTNFQILKATDLFKMQYDSGVAQGAAITWNDGIVLAADGGIYFDNLLQQTAAGLVVEYWDATGEIYAETSTKRFKEDIRELNVDTSKLLNLTPKSYTDKETGREEFGLIAEEVAEIMPEVVVFDEKDKPLGIKLTKLPIMNLNEIKKLDKRLLALEA